MLHQQQTVPKEFDWCFVGNLFGGDQTDLINRLKAEFPNSYVGRKYLLEMARVYCQSRLIFNRSILNDVNMRVFEGSQ